METPRVRLGELLVRAGLITAEQLDDALREQSRVGKRLGSLLVDSGLVSETQVTQILSQQLSIPWVSLHHIDFSRQLLDLVPLDLVARFCLIPIYVRRVRGLGDALYVAMDDPTNAQALKDVAERSGLHVRAMIAPPSDIRSAIKAYYGIGEDPPPAPIIPRDDEEEEVPTGIHPRVTLQSSTTEAGEPASGPRAAPSPSQPELDRAVDDLVARPAAAAPSSSPIAAPPAKPAAGEGASQDATARAARKGSVRRMIALTLLDGTTIQVPAKGKQRAAGAPAALATAAAAAVAPAPPASAPAQQRPEPPQPEPEARAVAGDQLTAKDLIAALRAASHGADASEVLGENVKWEAMFAALLSLLLKKHLISDWEFVDEYKKV